MKVWKYVLMGLGLLAFVGAVAVVREARDVPKASPSSSGSSITDVARTPVGTIAGPMRATGTASAGELLPPPPVVLPSAMPDPANPPRWTEPLAMPGPPQPPDPNVPPPMVVDPNRGRIVDGVNAPTARDAAVAAP